MQAMSERLLREMQDMRALLANSQSNHAASQRQQRPLERRRDFANCYGTSALAVSSPMSCLRECQRR